MLIHQKARTLISQLDIPAPIKKYFSNDSWEIDLSNNTNPYIESFAKYPNVQQNYLKNLYLETIDKLNFFDYHKCKNISFLSPKNLLFTVGSMEGIDILLRTFCEPNQDSICVIEPTFSAYEHWALLHNLDVKKVPLYGKEMNAFSVEEVIKTKSKMVFLCNPNNPIGTSVKAELISTLCEEVDGLVVVDEAYIEFSDQPSSLMLLSTYKNLIVLRTFSKAWGLAGVRCGIILADPLIIHSLRYVQLPYSFSAPSQELVRQSLLYPERIFASWERIRKNRQYLIAELSVLENVQNIFNSETNFIMLVLKNFCKTLDLLKQEKIQIFNCSAHIPHSIRVSIGTEEQNKKFLEVMNEVEKFS